MAGPPIAVHADYLRTTGGLPADYLRLAAIISFGRWRVDPEGARRDDHAMNVLGGPQATGQRLRQARLAALLTLEELAESSGVSVRAISDLERGRTRKPYPRTVRLLAAALGLAGPAGGELGPLSRLAGRGVTVGQEPPAPAASAQLPAGAWHFSGRSAELATLTRWACEPAGSAGSVVITAIGGTAGVGKTALALHWAHQIAPSFPDGQLYFDLRGFGPSGPPASAAEVIRGFLDALQVPASQLPTGTEARAGLYRSVLAGRRMLIVLDNARDAAQVRPLLPAAPGCLMLVTSRHMLTGLAAADGARLLTLNLLTEAEARELLARRLGPGRITAEPAAVTELIGRCARLPLALSIAAARSAARPDLPLAAVAAELCGSQARLDALDTGDPATDVRTVFSWSCQQLSDPAARMFRLLGVHPGHDITAPAAASLAGVSLRRASQALAELARAHLITEQGAGRHSCHDLLRAYATEQARGHDSAASRRAALHRILDHYLHTACAASRLLHPYRDLIALDPPRPRVRPEEFADRQQALDWFQAERQVLLAAISQATSGGFSTHAWQLPWAVATFLNWRGYWHELATTQESALAAASRLGHLAGQAEAHRYLGQAQIRFGACAEARSHLTAALELFGQLGSGAAQARAHFDLAHIFELQGRSRAALGHAEQSLRLYRTAAHRPGEAIALNAVGAFHAQLGRYDKALDYSAQALAMHRELGNRTGEAATLDSLGSTYHHLGQHAEAIACYQQAIDALGAADDLHLRAAALARLGDAHYAAGNDDAARGAWQEAVAILDDLRHPDADRVRSRLAWHPVGNGAARPPGAHEVPP
jgi:tetratricopeptide (TPR) repeat protein/transcriptional regulator with XRE-family HTH domain